MPISPVTRPAARSPDSTRYAVEVFPAVPVIPTIVSFSVGRSYTVAATSPRTARGSSTTSAGSGEPEAPAGSVSTATAPARAAAPMNRAPCAFAPGSAANRSPGTTAELARVTPDTGTSTPGGATPSSSASSARLRGGTVRGRG